jgi:hypothetical protein
MEYEDAIFLIVTLIYKKRQSAVISNHCLVLKEECKSMPPIPSSEATNRVCMHLEDDLLTKSLSKYSGVSPISQSSRVKAPAGEGAMHGIGKKAIRKLIYFPCRCLCLGFFELEGRMMY